MNETAANVETGTRIQVEPPKTYRYFIWDLYTNDAIAYLDVNQPVIPVALCDTAFKMNQSAGHLCRVVARADEYDTIRAHLGIR